MDSVFLTDLIHHLLVMDKSSCTMLLVERLPSKIYTTASLKLSHNQTLLHTLFSTTVTSHGNRKQRDIEDRERNEREIPIYRHLSLSVFMTVVVPIKFGTLNLQRGTEVGVIPATCKP